MMVPSAIVSAQARLGRIDGLVNCAAIVIHADPLETAWRDWEKTFAEVTGRLPARSPAVSATVAG